MKKIADFGSNFIKVIIMIVLSALVGWGLLLLVILLPSDVIDAHVAQSASIIEEEGTYPLFLEDKLVRMTPENMLEIRTLLLNNRMTARDNYTDSFMLMNAAYDGKGEGVNNSPVYRSLMAYRYEDITNQPHWTLIEYYGNNNPMQIKVAEYARYWHGYLVVLRPLLLFMNYGGIRIFNLILMSALVLAIAGSLYRCMRESGMRVGQLVAVIFSFLFLMPFTIPLCMQYCTCGYILLVSTLFIVRRGERITNVSLFFAGIGIVTSYVDYLTYPLATFGIPILLIMMLYPEKVRKLGAFVSCGFFWCMGYAGMWAMKWILTNLFTDKNLIKEAIEQVLFRTSSVTDEGDAAISIASALISNLCNYVNAVYILLGIAALVFCIFYLSRRKRPYAEGCLYLLCGVLPFAWYVIVRNHSYSHGSFTYRLISITVLAVMLYCEEGTNVEKPKEIG